METLLVTFMDIVERLSDTVSLTFTEISESLSEKDIEKDYATL